MSFTLEDFARFWLPNVKPGRMLAESELRTLRDVAEIILEGAPFEIPVEDVADNLDRFLTAGRSRRAWRCRLLLTLVEYLPLATTGRPFHLLGPEARRRYVVEGLMSGRGLYGVCAKVRYLAMFGAYGDKRAHTGTGFKRPQARPRLAEAERKRALTLLALGGEL